MFVLFPGLYKSGFYCTVHVRFHCVICFQSWCVCFRILSGVMGSQLPGPGSILLGVDTKFLAPCSCLHAKPKPLWLSLKYWKDLLVLVYSYTLHIIYSYHMFYPVISFSKCILPSVFNIFTPYYKAHVAIYSMSPQCFQTHKMYFLRWLCQLRLKKTNTCRDQWRKPLIGLVF